MSSTSPQTGSSRKTSAPAAQRPSIVLPAFIVGLLIVGGAVAYKLFENPPPTAAPATTTQAAAWPADSRPIIRSIVPREGTAQTSTAPTASAPKAAPTPAPASEPIQPTVDSKELMATLLSLNTNGPISADDAKKWKDSLQQLIRQGASSVPAIQQYLAQNQDINFAGVAGADQLGVSSLRAGLLDALGQIGGPEATQAMLQILQSSVYPTDIATLASSLEQQSPGQYQPQILSAVRSQLAQAAQDQLGGANVGPLFQVLATEAANGTDVSADLAQYGSKWPYYSSIELANLPNGAGVPSLVQMANSDNGPAQSAATQALAELAPQSKLAQEALVNMASQLSDGALAQLAPYLAGRDNQLGPVDNPPGGSTQTLHISNGNQDFSAYDGLNTLTPSQATQSISVIDQILQSIPATDTLAQQALQEQKINLIGRAGK